MDFLGGLLTVLLFGAIAKELTKTQEDVTTIVPDYEYSDAQYVSEVSFSTVPRALLSDVNLELRAETEYISSDYGEYYITEEHIQLESIVTVATEMEFLCEGKEDSDITTEQVQLDDTRTMQAEIDATPTIQAKIDATPTSQAKIDTTTGNFTSVTYTEKKSLSAGSILLKLASVMLAVVSAALFITIMLIICNKNLIVSSTNDENLNNINSNDPELGEVKYQDTFTV